MKTLAFALGLVVTAIPVLAIDWAEKEITGPARIIDGDTIELLAQLGQKTRIRLWGIDAPESNQWCERESIKWPCGREATEVLRHLIAGRPVTCQAKDKDRYGRTVAQCSVRAAWSQGGVRAGSHQDSGIELNKEMVKRGYAIDYKRYSLGAYKTEEEYAQKLKLGIWAGRFESPETWRHPR